MPDEALISQIENILSEVVELGGANERSSIVPNLTVQDANPTNLDGWIIVSDDRDGDNILAKKVPSVVYTNSDLVNVLFPRGGEAVAFQQGSQSAGGDLWEIVPSTTTDIFYDKGKVGIGTETIPHGGVGWAQLALEGADFDIDGPHIQMTTDADDFPVMQLLPWGHDEMAISFDSYYDGAWRSSANTGNFQLFSSSGRFNIRYDDNIAAGNAVTWNNGIVLRADSGAVGLGTTSPRAQLEVIKTTKQLALTHTANSKFVEFTLDTNHDLTIKPSSTGQIILQPTTDSTDFFQVLDADGGTPIFNVDSTNERVGQGTAAPAYSLEIIYNANDANGRIAIENQNSGAAALPLLQVQNDSTSFFQAGVGSTTHSNTIIQDTAFFQSNSTNLVIRALNAGGFIQFYGGGAGTVVMMRLQDDKHVGFAVASPQGQIHAYDTISGFLNWEYDGLDGTVRTVVPNGAGDVLYRLTAMYVLRDSAGAVASGTVDISNGAFAALVVGGNTVRLRVNADGSCDTWRFAGADTIKVGYVLKWL